MGWAMQDIALVGPHQAGSAAAVDGDGDGIRQIAVAAGYRTEDAVGADPAHVHDIARSAGLIELGRGRGTVGCLGKGHCPGRQRTIRRIEVRRAEPDKVHAPGAAGRNPGEIVSPRIVVGLYWRRPDLPLIARMCEPDIVLASRNQIIRKDGVDVTRHPRHAGIIDSESSEDPIRVRLPRPADIAVKDQVSVVHPTRRGQRPDSGGRRRVSDPQLMKIFDLANVASLGCVCHRVGGDPLHVDFAGFRIDLDVAWNRVAEGLRFGDSVLRKDIDRRTEGLPAIVRSRHVDLTGRKVVIADVDLILIRRCLTRKNRQPRPVDKGRIDRREIVDGPSGAPVVAVGDMGLEDQW